MIRFLIPLLLVTLIVTSEGAIRSSQQYSKAGQTSATGGSGSLLDDLLTYEVVTPQKVQLPPQHAALMGFDAQANQDASNNIHAFEMTAFGRHFRILGKQADLFAPNYVELVLDQDGNEVSRNEAPITDCFYHGVVDGDPDSRAVFSTCGRDASSGAARPSLSRHGKPPSSSKKSIYDVKSSSMTPHSTEHQDVLALDGYIEAFGEKFYIESAAPHSSRLQSYQPGHHLVFRNQDLRDQQLHTCGVEDENDLAQSDSLFGAHNDEMGGQHPAPAEFGFTTKSRHPQALFENEASESAPSPSSTNEQPAPASSDNIQVEDGGVSSGSGSAGRRLLSIWPNPTGLKYVEVVIVNDYQRWLQRGTTCVQMSKDTFNAAAALYASASTSSWKYGVVLKLVGMVTFAFGDPYAAPSAYSATEVNVSPLLTNFRTWTYTGQSKFPANDATVLLSGYEFAGSTIGLAVVGTMCTRTSSTQSACMAQANARNNLPTITAVTMAHEIGHLFGLQHDDYPSPPTPPIPSLAWQQTTCDLGTGGVMDSVASSSTPATTWSQCASLYYNYWIGNQGSGQYNTSSRTACLENIPSTTWTDTAAKCGDGIVQSGEDCDCGVSDCSTVDPCCNGATCKLVSGAKCSVRDSCCQSCQIVTDGRVCRAAVNSGCDAVERCNGVSKTCPADVWINHGKSCVWNSAYSNGVCYQGDCYSHTRQCQMSSNAGLTGLQCGGHSDTTNSDTACTYLYCALASGCLYSLSPVDIRYVFDGTPCGPSKQCYQSKCVASSTLPNQNGPAASTSTGSTGSTGSTSTGSTGGATTGGTTGSTGGTTAATGHTGASGATGSTGTTAATAATGATSGTTGTTGAAGTTASTGTTGSAGSSTGSITGVTMVLSWSTIYTVSWTQQTAGNVQIQLLNTANTPLVNIVTSLAGKAGANQYLWTVPANARLPSGTYKTRVTSLTSNQYGDTAAYQLVACTYNPCRVTGSTCTNPSGTCTCPAGTVATVCNPPLAAV